MPPEKKQEISGDFFYKNSYDIHFFSYLCHSINQTATNMKKILSITCMLLIALTTLAQKSPNLHAVFQQNGILTVYYDTNEPEGENFRFIDWN